MRILSMITGFLLAICGVFAIANAGLAFISMAFPIGIVLIIVGIVECFSYKRTIETDEEKHWLLIEGLTTFVLGIVVLTGQLAADIAVPVVFGMWILVSGIRGMVVFMQVEAPEGKKDIDYYWNAVVSALNIIFGLYTFFNSMIFQFPVLLMLGVCFVVQGAHILKIGWDMHYIKPEVIKTKDEKIADAEEAAAQAHKEVKKAIKRARKAKANVEQVTEEAKDYQEIVAEPVNPDAEVENADEEPVDEEATEEAGKE